MLSATVSRSLRHLQFLSDLPKVTNAGYLKINRVTELELFEHYGLFPQADGKFLSDLQLRKLKALLIWQSQIEGGWFSKLITESPDLETLSLQGVRVTAEDIQALKQFESLKRLTLISLSDFSMTDNDLEAIGILPRLEHLDLVGNKNLTDAGLRSLGQGKQLKDLRFVSARLTDAACEAIATFDALEFLVIGEARITDAGVAKLTVLPKLTQLHIKGNKHITDASLDSLAKLTGLQVLDIANKPQLTEPPFANFRPRCRLARSCRTIRTLRDAGCKRSGGAGFRAGSTAGLLAVGSRKHVAAVAEDVTGKLPKPLLAPYSPEQAKEGQAAWAKALERDVVKAGPVGMQFVLIPPGEFEMWWNEGPNRLSEIAHNPSSELVCPKLMNSARPK